MSFTFDFSNQIGRVRNYTDDNTDGVEGTDYFLSDERIQLLLDDVESDALVATTAVNRAKLAAAAALGILAKNQAYVLKVGATMGEDWNGKDVADSIRADARVLRDQVVASEAKIAQEAVSASSSSVRRRYSGYSSTELVF